MAQTEKIFRDILCEGRALPAETTDPAGARTIDELRKQVSKLKWELEAEKQKIRQLYRDHEIDRQFTLMWELLMKLLFPRGASKGAVFIKQFEVSVFKYNCYQLVLPLMFLYCCAVEVKI